MRDPRGFAVKFYTEDGNWDLVGNNTPIDLLYQGSHFSEGVVCVCAARVGTTLGWITQVSMFSQHKHSQDYNSLFLR